MKKETIWAIIVGLLTLLLGQGILTEWIYKPSLSYEILPTYRLPTYETHSIVIRNNGPSMVHNVIVSINTDSIINDLRIDGPEVIDKTGKVYITGGGIGGKFLQISLRRMINDTTISLTFLTPHDADVNITIASDEVRASKVESKSQAGPLDYVLLVMSALLIGASVYMIVRQHRLVSNNSCLNTRKKSGSRLKKAIDIHVVSLGQAIDIIKVVAGKLKDQPELETILNDVCNVIQKSKNEFESYGEKIASEGLCYDLVNDKEEEK